MALKELNPQLQFKFDEYCEIWESLLREHYSQAMETAITDKMLGLDAEALPRYSLECSTVFLVVGHLTWSGRRGMASDLKEKVFSQVASNFFAEVYAGDTEEKRNAYLSFYRQQFDVFSEICRNLAGSNAKRRKMDLIGLTRYLVAQVSEAPEEENIEVIERIGTIMVSFSNACLRLTANTSQALQSFGKPRFVVQK